jgi:two-component system, chemotaxis family, CheB/CheR fusion protein
LRKFESELPDAAMSLLNKIADSSQRMRKLIEGLLEFSKSDLNEQEYLYTDLNSVLKTVLSDFELMISEKNVTINSDKLPSLEAIPIQMEQLLHNMISNSIKFSKSDVRPVITISTKKPSKEELKSYGLDGKTQHVELKFADNGIGFEPEYSEQIFDIFQRLNDKQEFPGTGIGLALCRKIVTNHKGKIKAEGVADKGATFRIILPLNQK